MKINQTISLDIKLAERLRQEDNASALINALLMTHFKDMRTDEEIIGDVKKLITIKEEAQARDERIRLGVIKRSKEMAKIPFIKNVKKSRKTR